MAWLPKFPTELKLLKYEIEGYARDYGLDFFDVIFEVVGYEGMNEIAAYGGFPVRYPHWRHGMEYEQLSKGYAYGLQKIYEMVINNDPCYAYLLRSNDLVDQKLVIAHVYGHCDFFKNNLWFSRTNRKMMDEMANHGTRIRSYIERYGEDEVESFVDACLSVEDLIDPHAPFIKREENGRSSVLQDEAEEERTVRKLKSKSYMDSYVNPREFLEAQKKEIEAEKEKERQFPEAPKKDVLEFLIDHAPLENWQSGVLSIVREEAYYFSPQRQTKILNEGWACIVSHSLVYTDEGLMRMQDLVEGRRPVCVSDGETFRRVYDWARFEDRETVWVRTKRGYEVEGSLTHQLMLPDGSWRRLDEVGVGDCVAIGAGMDLWPEEKAGLDWRPERRLTLEEIARQAGVDISTVIRHKYGWNKSRSAGVLDPLLARYEQDLRHKGRIQNSRTEIRVPEVVDENLAAFLGYLLSDGNVSECKRVVSLTTGDEEQANRFAELAMRLFDLKPRLVLDGSRWRVHLYSLELIDFLKYLGLHTGRCARTKSVPEVILRSPKQVVTAFLSAYFDGDGYAGKQGAILSTFSEAIGKTFQLLLLNFGILSTRKRQNDGGWHLRVAGRAAETFLKEIGFGLKRKQEALRTYVYDRRWFLSQPFEDEIVEIERRRADVYDVSVEGTHRYAAQGFVNHNSYWHSKILTEKALKDSELIDFAEHHAGTMGTRPGRINPYKLGLELFLDIEERWNKGKFGPEYEACEDMEERACWDRQTGLGMDKIFEVRKVYNDIGFIDTFLTEDFCREQKLFTYAHNEQKNVYEIESREFEKVKKQLLYSLTNFGRPFIQVVEGNFRNRGELLLVHRYDGNGIEMDYAKDTLRNLRKIWGRPVHLETGEGKEKMLLSCEEEEVKVEKVK